MNEFVCAASVIPPRLQDEDVASAREAGTVPLRRFQKSCSEPPCRGRSPREVGIVPDIFVLYSTSPEVSNVSLPIELGIVPLIGLLLIVSALNELKR